MSDPASPVRDALVRPADASYGSTLGRWTAVAFVGGVAGLLSAMATYVFRLESLAAPWASTELMGTVILLSGAFVKLLCQNLRTSVVAFAVSFAVGALAGVAFAAAPYYLLGISTAGGWVLLPAVRDVVTFALVWQFPLQVSGYLLAVLYDGLRA